MDDKPTADFSIDRRTGVMGAEEGYDLWFDLAPREGDATTSEFQTLCKGAMMVGFVASKMGWDWPTTMEMIGHLAAPVDGYLLIEIDDRVFYGPQFRRALTDSVAAAGLDPAKIRVSNMDRGDIYVLDDGLPEL